MQDENDPLFEKREVAQKDQFKLLQHLFNRYVTSKGIQPKHYPHVGPQPFVKWLHDEASVDPMLLALELELQADDVEYVINALMSPLGLNALSAVWPHLTLARREQKHKLRAFNLALLLQWDDGTVAPLTAYAHKDITQGELTDAAVSAMVSQYTPQIMAGLKDASLDELHDKYGASPGLQGLCDAQVFNDLEQAIQKSGQSDTVKERMMRVVNFMFSMLPPEVPVNVMQLLEDQKARKQGRDPEAPPAQQRRGGWSLDHRQPPK